MVIYYGFILWSWDKSIKISNPTNGTLTRRLSGHNGSIYALTTRANGNLVSGSTDKTIRICNINDGSTIRLLTGHTDYVQALVSITNGDLASASIDKTI